MDAYLSVIIMIIYNCPIFHSVDMLTFDRLGIMKHIHEEMFNENEDIFEF